MAPPYQPHTPPSHDQHHHQHGAPPSANKEKLRGGDLSAVEEAVVDGAAQLELLGHPGLAVLHLDALVNRSCSPPPPNRTRNPIDRRLEAKAPAHSTGAIDGCGGASRTDEYEKRNAGKGREGRKGLVNAQHAHGRDDARAERVRLHACATVSDVPGRWRSRAAKAKKKGREAVPNAGMERPRAPAA